MKQNSSYKTFKISNNYSRNSYTSSDVVSMEWGIDFEMKRQTQCRNFKIENIGNFEAVVSTLEDFSMILMTVWFTD